MLLKQDNNTLHDSLCQLTEVCNSILVSEWSSQTPHEVKQLPITYNTNGNNRNP